MLNIGSKLVELRKAKNLSQEDLAKEISSSRVMIGKYERNDNAPSIEVLLKLAKAFDVSVDYIIGEGQLSTYDKDVLKRIEDIEQLDDETKSKLFFLIDNIIQNFKTKQAFS
ncbi:helix-turn-helix transcriptional regulator [Lutibacter sp.]|uniref:helix-turn-helix domain-containing protein n=1 Tax=Lutibacter sp. TaxID=1925666 RepID=UPI0025BB87BB|nr:helix-turn-helix transcriptional regulator [Lutibacter sp.]MCF6168395.1 helix-turn-helix domain-containing protein [Lutibacter sp.]